MQVAGTTCHNLHLPESSAGLPTLQERVLLAERALLYAFAFDFAKGDPFSFALKYNRLHSTESLVDSDAAEIFFTWLTFAGQATTLCLQYPPSLLAVASLWYAQHLSKGQVSVKLVNFNSFACSRSANFVVKHRQQ